MQTLKTTAKILKDAEHKVKEALPVFLNVFHYFLKFTTQFQNIEVNSYLDEGDAGEAIVRFSNEAKVDLIVLGCRGLGAIKR